MAAPDAATLQRLVDENEIKAVLYRYCRAVDRRDLDLLRSCYHPEAIDVHGSFVGTVDDMVESARNTEEFFESTMHFLGNIVVEADGDRARSEAYAIACHRFLPHPEKPVRDFFVGLRYVDDFERRDGDWKIRNRVCVYEWTRTDPVGPGWNFGPQHVRGRRDREDTVYTKRLGPFDDLLERARRPSQGGEKEQYGFDA